MNLIINHLTKHSSGRLTPPLSLVIRYLINGLFATAVHYLVLTINLNLLMFKSAGVANGVAAVFGISSSFLGNRYFVFQSRKECILAQAARFGGLYLLIAILHGLILYVWSDLYSLDYRLGFLLATTVQVILSYIGNKLLIFRK